MAYLNIPFKRLPKVTTKNHKHSNSG